MKEESVKKTDLTDEIWQFIGDTYPTAKSEIQSVVDRMDISVKSMERLNLVSKKVTPYETTVVSWIARAGVIASQKGILAGRRAPEKHLPTVLKAIRHFEQENGVSWQSSMLSPAEMVRILAMGELTTAVMKSRSFFDVKKFQIDRLDTYEKVIQKHAETARKLFDFHKQLTIVE